LDGLKLGDSEGDSVVRVGETVGLIEGANVGVSVIAVGGVVGLTDGETIGAGVELWIVGKGDGPDEGNGLGSSVAD
jgi:hypothetical protein